MEPSEPSSQRRMRWVPEPHLGRRPAQSMIFEAPLRRIRSQVPHVQICQGQRLLDDAQSTAVQSRRRSVLALCSETWSPLACFLESWQLTRAREPTAPGCSLGVGLLRRRRPPRNTSSATNTASISLASVVRLGDAQRWRGRPPLTRVPSAPPPRDYAARLCLHSLYMQKRGKKYCSLEDTLAHSA